MRSSTVVAARAWVNGIPLAWDAAVTLTASWQKIFSTDLTLGLFAQASNYSTALTRGKVITPAKNLEQMGTVVTNSIVDGVPSILFAILITIVLADGVRARARALSSPAPMPNTETPFVESTIVAAPRPLGGRCAGDLVAPGPGRHRSDSPA